MARNICILPAGFSESMARDCKKHRHLKKSEVSKRLTAGEIVFLDVHPITQLARYRLTNARWSPSGITATDIRHASGQAQTGDEIKRAKEKIAEWSLAGTHKRWTVLPSVSFDAEDVWFGRQ